jgi:hypothetical protein
MNRVNKAQINQAMNFFRDFLFQKQYRLAMNTYIDVEVKRDIGADGWCFVEDDDVRPREFTIQLEKTLDELALLTTLAHEMVHVWQYATGKLRLYQDGKHRYDGKVYSSNTKYVDRPWESEAYELERVLVEEWLNRVPRNTRR